jgi:hypothetical protein
MFAEVNLHSQLKVIRTKEVHEMFVSKGIEVLPLNTKQSVNQKGDNDFLIS